MELAKLTAVSVLTLLIGASASLAQTSPKEPLGRNQTEAPGQAREVAPREENRNMDTTPTQPPATTGSIAPRKGPAAADDDVPDENRSVSGKVQEETPGSTQD
ncbi:exported protein of unknown function [Candidatus Filomicrobium marinum]|uniref:Secreted protein n=1 Tax=Candidatus Filomicrobium marinum TaxID=1608628 RepID=A0A0D6JBD2_9HYPH|nr:hypothetical protein [Candidatus Filomicrobium marinum]CFX04551.1 exported protein of unknown function [Candidatus Filomicrobium marinum]CPR16082.1 exported protein of unknown function [Candidatus Filomicrobium marinum]